MATYPSTWKEKVKEFCGKQKKDMSDLSGLDAELDIWNTMWLNNSSIGELPCNVEAVLKTISPVMFPNIEKIMHLLAVYPVTTCSCERSISTLRRLKTYLRSRMGQVYFKFVN